jgi:hypothetical protein
MPYAVCEDLSQDSLERRGPITAAGMAATGSAPINAALVEQFSYAVAGEVPRASTRMADECYQQFQA